MEQVNTVAQLIEAIKRERFSLCYVSRKNCSVCVSLLPQLEERLKHYPMIRTFCVDTEKISEIASEWMIFTVPAVLLFVEGKEFIRKARFIPLDELEHEIAHIIALAN